ncbi:hypothetical protein ACI2L4_08750 [Streptomyces sparsogenes]|uniref:hypothetical protein n=1 Tax=Streptomyces sparsogenes TaxID=67365 RepID=UPI0034008EC6
MTDTSAIPASPRTPSAQGLCVADPFPVGGSDADDLVIEDLSADPWPAPALGICICTISAG